MTWRELSPEQLNRLKDQLIVDVRSPGEHAVEYIPGSINVPLLSNDERAEVGTLYKQHGEITARRRALAIIAPKIPLLIDQILEAKSPGQGLVVHCWRGGLRSEAVASFLSVIGIDCWRLKGGYKAWRHQVLADLKIGDYKFSPLVLHGLTGVGKTDILKGLAARGFAVLDLEELANHRGSVFGGMGLGQQPTQKNFEAHLWQELRCLPPEPLFLEAESRKVGAIALPDFIFEKIQFGTKILVTASLQSRIERIVRQYAPVFDRTLKDQGKSLLQSLKERLGARRLHDIQDLALSGKLTEAVDILLTEYYDPLYLKQLDKASPFDLEINADNIEQAIEELINFAHKQKTPA